MCRALLCLALVVVLVVAMPRTLAQGSLIGVDDHFLSVSGVDQGATTAFVDTASPGLVYLPSSGGAVALRPGTLQLAAVASGGLKGYAWDGTRMVRDVRLDISFPGVVAVAFSSDGGLMAAATSSQVRFWGFDASGYARTLAALGGFSRIVALEPGRGWDFWVLEPSRAVCLGFDGVSWRPAFSLSLSRGLSMSWSAARKSLVVLDGDRVRYFGFDGSRFVEVPGCGVSVSGALGVVQHGHGYSVVAGRMALGYALTASGAARVPALDLALPEDGLGGAVSSWGEYDWVAVTSYGARYAAWTGSSWLFDPARTVVGASGGYRDSAELRSVVFPASEPVSRVRLEAEYQVSAKTSLAFEVSTDGGVTWVPVPLAVNTDVPEGSLLCYRVFLATADSSVTPVLDRVRLLQIGYVQGRSRVKLIR
ncbi:MAG: hypothetical protein QME87_10105 [Bacillota bacterium]|nr:hypothetical protein [Bacillota bacterium]